MQVRLSWQILAAILIFILAICVLGRLLIGAFTGSKQPTPISVTTVTLVIAPSPTLVLGTTATAPQASPAPQANPAMATPSAAPTPSATTPSVTPTPTPSVTSTPTPSMTPTPTPTATPTPETLHVVATGFAQSSGVLAYAFTVINPNPNLMVRDTRYQMVAYDAGGIVIKTGTGTIGLLGPSGQTGVAAFLQLADGDGRRAVRVEVIIGGGLFLQPTDLLPITSENLAFVPGDKPLATGLLRNPYSRDLQDLPVAAILYAADDTIIGGGSATVPFILAGGQAAAEVPVLASGEPTRVEIYPRLDKLMTP